ncbi:MAG: hypothetical protein MRY79_04860 [Alphaproteobacteria bacterium]|nr:hypothetical protein [Alphaproteobacteria bacterium]
MNHIPTGKERRLLMWDCKNRSIFGTRSLFNKGKAGGNVILRAVLILSLLAPFLISGPTPTCAQSGAAERAALRAGAQGQQAANQVADNGGASATGGGCIDREKQHQEFNGNDAAINNLCGLTKIEVGFGNPECVTMFIESVMNRAEAMGTSVQSRLNDCAYWGLGCSRKKVTASEMATCKASLDRALSGSNLCNYCTDNASAGLAKRRQAAGNPGVWCDYGSGDEFFYTNYDVPKHKQWRKEAEAKAPSTQCTARAAQGGNHQDTGNDVTNGDPGVVGPPVTSDPVQAHFNNLSQALKYIWVAAFQIMTNHMSTTMMQQAEIIGTFFDAKHQLETQRLMQQKYAQAHKDYHPSVQMCEFGTFARDLANTEARTKATQAALSRSMLDRQLVSGDGVQTAEASLSDKRTRLGGFIDKFCNKLDNAKQNDLLCQKGSPDKDQINRDIDYTATIDLPMTLKLNMVKDGSGSGNKDDQKDKENVFALLDNIFMNDPWPLITSSHTEKFRFSGPYQDLRSLTAMRSVAQNSFAHIIGIKSQGPDPQNDDVDPAAPFMKALMRDLGMEDTVIEELLGKNPSYYAQMEMLTKKIYQHPEFIANLYDKPANVKRIRATLTAIKLMQDRDIHQAMQRREMLMSMLLELQLRNKQPDLNNQIEKVIEAE